MVYAVCIAAGFTVGLVVGNFQCRYLFGLPPWKDEQLWRELDELRENKKASDEVKK